MTSYPPLPAGLWFVSDKPWHRRWETWLVVVGLFGVGFFIGRGRR